MAAFKRYVIIRDIPDIAQKNKQELGAISGASCTALSKAGLSKVQWQHSYVADGKTFCIYLATDEEAIREHASIGGFPITSIHEVTEIIDPTTAGFA
ncbi:hypothetical protein COHA_000997 [Chlorella ohadii]|uniref:DUF4242 domain-containing protein n=1 Tax=Chlorella ohadii TaxID=2649997 RepID=A0AAD5DVZ3_9CHLO|nr:hypothetical protein COHA_000997 [Chlorella ohadii]